MTQHRWQAPADVEPLIIRPGDKLVIRTKTPMSCQDLDDLRERILASLPGVEVVVIYTEQMLVYRPDSAEVCGARFVRDYSPPCPLPAGHPGAHQEGDARRLPAPDEPGTP